MKKYIRLTFIAILIALLTACNLNIFSKPIDPATLNHISTIVMNANVKINTSTYRIDFFHKIIGPYKAYGSGVIYKEVVDKENIYYYVLTNAHVIHLDDNYNHEYLIEDVYGNEINAELVTFSMDYDLAVLKFKATENLYVIELARENPKVGETVFSVGSPSGRLNIITAGHILKYSKINRVNYEIIIHDAIIYNGSSGGMLINQNYKLVGINTWGFSNKNDLEDDYVNGGATPIEKILEFLSSVTY